MSDAYRDANDQGAQSEGTGSTNIVDQVKLADHLCAAGLYNTEEDVAKNFDSLVNELSTWIDENSSPRNAALLRLMLEEKEQSRKSRRDGMPNASHEILQAIMFIRDMEDGMNVDNPDRVLSLILSHDMGEDFGYWPEDIREYLVSQGVADDEEMEGFLEDFKTTSHHFLDETGAKVENYKNKTEYLKAICQSPSASIAKFYDNIHNINTAIFGFKKDENLIQYVSRIQALMPDNLAQLKEDHPSQKSTYNKLYKMVENAIQPVVHWMAGDIGQELSVQKHNKPKNQTPLPSGLDTPEIGTNRVLKVFDGQKTLFEQNNFDADNEAQPV